MWPATCRRGRQASLYLTARRPRAWGSPRRTSTTPLRRLRAAAGLDAVHAAEPVPRDPGSGAAVSGPARSNLHDIYIEISRATAGRDAPGAPSPITSVNGISAPIILISHHGAVSRDDGVLQSRAGSALGAAVTAIQKVRRSCRRRPAMQGSFQGTAQAFIFFDQ
jgi:hypothetical protein